MYCCVGEERPLNGERENAIHGGNSSFMKQYHLKAHDEKKISFHNQPNEKDEGEKKKFIFPSHLFYSFESFFHRIFLFFLTDNVRTIFSSSFSLFSQHYQ